MTRPIWITWIFGVLCLLLVGVADASTMQRTQTAIGLHETAWIDAATKAQDDPAYKYAIYQARTLAVKHPELYLQADALFNQILLSEDNMGRYYSNRTQYFPKQESEYEAIHKKKGGRFRWSKFSIDNHDVVGYDDIYHTKAFLPFVDIRLHLMASALKGTNGQATPLSMAEFLYFQHGAKKNSFLLVTEQGIAYVYIPAGFGTRQRLLKYNGEEIEQIEEKVVLIFNQKHVWYPLMDRDDRSKSKRLVDLVETYAKEDSVPKLTAKEREIVALLKLNTSFDSEQDERFALAYAAKLHATSWRYYPELFKKLYPSDAANHGFNRSHAPRFFIHRNAHVAWLSNLISPITAELAAIARENKDKSILDHIISPMIREYMKHVATSDGRTGLRLWFHPELHCLNLDDNVLSKAANCLYSAANTAAMLDLANIEDLEIMIASMVYEKRSDGHAYTVVFRGSDHGTLDNGGWTVFNGLYDSHFFSRYGTVLTGFTLKNGWVNFSTWSDVGLREITTSLDSKTMKSILEGVREKTRGRTKIGVVSSGDPVDETHLITDFVEMAPRMKVRKFKF